MKIEIDPLIHCIGRAMNQARCALIFVSQKGADIALINALEELRIRTMWPWQQTDDAPEVAIIIIDRPAANALKICANLRAQPQFATAPLVVLLDEAERHSFGQFSHFEADVITKPLRYQTVHHYLSTKLNSSTKSELKTLSLPYAVDPYERETEVIGVSGAIRSGRVSDGADTFIDDVIPTSELLFPFDAAAQAPSDGPVECATCHLWECRREDSFCAGCGAPLAVLSITDEVVSFEPLGAHKVGSLVEMKSNGINPVRMSFKVDGLIARRFKTHAREAILDAGETGHLLVILDARELDLAAAYDAVLEITCNEKGRSTRRVRLEVKGGG